MRSAEGEGCCEQLRRMHGDLAAVAAAHSIAASAAYVDQARLGAQRPIRLQSSSIWTLHVGSHD